MKTLEELKTPTRENAIKQPPHEFQTKKKRNFEVHLLYNKHSYSSMTLPDAIINTTKPQMSTIEL